MDSEEELTLNVPRDHDEVAVPELLTLLERRIIHIVEERVRLHLESVRGVSPAKVAGPENLSLRSVACAQVLLHHPGLESTGVGGLVNGGGVGRILQDDEEGWRILETGASLPSG